MTKGEPRMKKLFSILLAFVLVAGVFAPVGLLPEMPKAEAETAPTCTHSPIEISSYTELNNFLRQAYNGMVLQLTADITLTNPTYDITIEPDMYNFEVVLDLNGHDITITGANSSNGLFYLCCPNSSFHIMNSAYKFNNISGTTSVIKTDLSAEGIVNLNNSTASCYIYPGISLQGSTSDALVKLYKFEEFMMYGSDITVTDASSYADCIAFYNGSLDGSNVIALNKANLTAKKGDCIDLRGAGKFTANSYDTFVLNHVMLNVNDDNAYAINLSDAKNADSTVKIGKLSMDPDRVNVEVDNPYYGLSYHSGLIQDIYSGNSVYFYNSKLMNTETMCSHSSRENVFTCSVKNGHIFMCSTCKCDYYISPHARKTYLAPTATAEGNTAGEACNSCGYMNYYKLPAESMVDPFTKVQEVASWASLANAVAVSHPTTIRLKNDIVVEDHNNSYTLTPKTRGNLVIDLNGYDLIVNSNKTKYLFNLSYAQTGYLGTNLSIVSTTDAGGGNVIFNTTKKNAAVVRLAHKANSFSAIRVGVILGSDTDSSLNTTEAYAQTYAIDVTAAHKLNIYTANVYNYKQNGTAIRFVVNAADTFKDTTVRIYRSAFKFNTFGLDFDNSVAMTATAFGDFTISNNNYFTPLNSTASVLDINGSSNTITLADIVDTDFHFVDGTYSVSPDKVIAYSNFDTGKEYYTKWRWNSSNQCEHEEFVNVLSAVFGHYRYCTRCKKGFAEDHTIVLDTDKSTDADHANDGIRYYYCANENCGYTESIVDPAIGHYPETDDEGEDIIIRKKAATCCESGVAADYYVCGYCREYILLETGAIVDESDVVLPRDENAHTFENGTCIHCGQAGQAEEFMKGDVDGNGKVDAGDARLALRASVGLDTLNDVQQKAADVDGRVGVSSSDARLILRVSVGLEAFN